MSGEIGVPLPLPYAKKMKPPRHYTGASAKRVTSAQVRRWCRSGPAKNVCLRLNEGVLGIDVDDYGTKRGRATLTRLVELYGPLPPTIFSSNRGAGFSVISLYRVPDGLHLRSTLTARHVAGGETGDIELIHSGARYMLCWPSMHPEWRRYKWYGADGRRLLDMPRLADLPWLPARWLPAVQVPEASLASLQPVPAAAGRVGVAPTVWSAADDQLLSRLAREVRAEATSRNNTLNNAAYTLGGIRHLAPDLVEAALLEAAATAGLPEGEARATVRSGMRAGRRRPLR